jgi:hypothetical protein
MKRCVHCQGKLGLGVRSRNLWNGRWWVHVRFCSTHCEARYELERYDATARRWRERILGKRGGSLNGVSSWRSVSPQRKSNHFAAKCPMRCSENPSSRRCPMDRVRMWAAAQLDPPLHLTDAGKPELFGPRFAKRPRD